VRRAGFIEFGAEDPETAVEKAISKPLFAHLNEPSKISPGSKKDHAKTRSKKSKLSLARTKKALMAEIRSNTRAAMDPFLASARVPAPSKTLLTGVKRKRSEPEPESEIESAQSHILGNSLVDYDSD